MHMIMREIPKVMMHRMGNDERNDANGEEKDGGRRCGTRRRMLKTMKRGRGMLQNLMMMQRMQERDADMDDDMDDERDDHITATYNIIT